MRKEPQLSYKKQAIIRRRVFASNYNHRRIADVRASKGVFMKREDTKVMSEEDEEKLFHCEKYNYQCCQVRDKVFIYILLMGMAFMLGMNFQTIIEQVFK